METCVPFDNIPPTGKRNAEGRILVLSNIQLRGISKKSCFSAEKVLVGGRGGNTLTVFSKLMYLRPTENIAILSEPSCKSGTTGEFVFYLKSLLFIYIYEKTARGATSESGCPDYMYTEGVLAFTFTATLIARAVG